MRPSKLQDWSCGVDNFHPGKVFIELSAPNTFQIVSMTTEQARDLSKALLKFATRRYSSPDALAVLHSETLGQLAIFYTGGGFLPVQFPEVIV